MQIYWSSISMYVINWNKFLIPICNIIPFCPFLLSTTLPFPCTLQTEITVMSKMHHISTITWFSRNRIFHWFSCLHCKNCCVQEFRGAENQRTYKENSVWFRYLVNFHPHNKFKSSLLPHFHFSAQHLTFFSHFKNIWFLS